MSDMIRFFGLVLVMLGSVALVAYVAWYVRGEPDDQR